MTEYTNASVKLNPIYSTLSTYNQVKRGSVNGPPLAASIPRMNPQAVLYPKKYNGYDALSYDDSNGFGYYTIDSGPYDGPCSQMNNRSCTGVKE